ncbi:arsenite efflux ATP-binding protein ArsA [Halospina denitrificans]|uniref:arsenite-transporting ATPase n=1 Tax=Halospina denitrificans TaxID=332522 RepID=A0A4R7JZE4_9GAMM|nr:ArsA family ATPase [Halospina denitrificans]TDT43007.1 arsenite efflux ATP-binding protein ArsA [Halospina denitrificans]
MLLGWLFRRPQRQPDTGAGARMTFFGGKGGVGKTTCASAFSVALAEQGQQVLLISTDPAHSLGDLWEQSLSANPVSVSKGVDALELDPDAALKRYMGEVRENLANLASPEVRDAAMRQADLAASSPGAEESALMDELVRLTLENSERYDQIVFDTAPTGHTLQLLQLPEAMRGWTDALLSKRRETLDTGRAMQGGDAAPEDRAARILEARRDRYAAMRDRLLDPNRTRFVPVLNPDRLSRQETLRMVKTLGEVGMRVDTLVINRVLPDSADGDFLARRREAEREHLEAIRRDFPSLEQVLVPLATDDVNREQGLAAVAAALAPLVRSTSPV